MAINDINRNFAMLKKKIAIKIEQAIKETGQNLLDETVQVTPMSPLGTETSGDLRKSGKLDIEKSGKNTEAVVTFGGGKVDYALRVHEMPNNTNWSESGTGNKYLEKTVDDNRKKYLKHIADKIRL